MKNGFNNSPQPLLRTLTSALCRSCGFESPERWIAILACCALSLSGCGSSADSHEEEHLEHFVPAHKPGDFGDLVEQLAMRAPRLAEGGQPSGGSDEDRVTGSEGADVVMAEMMFWGFAVRCSTSLVQASPFILVDFAVAAVLRRFFGYEETRRLFGEGTRSALLRAWIIGMLLPVCSLGAIPVIREMRRAGIRGGTILAFAMSGPLFNPLSLLYGLTLSEPIAILSFAACSLVIVTVAGLIWDRMFPDSALPPAEEKAVAYDYRRMLAVATSAGREAASGSLLCILIGLTGVGLLGALIPANSLQHTFNYDNPLAPVYMTGMAIPVYATPMLAMSQLGMMFQHANSIGAGPWSAVAGRACHAQHRWLFRVLSSTGRMP